MVDLSGLMQLKASMTERHRRSIINPGNHLVKGEYQDLQKKFQFNLAEYTKQILKPHHFPDALHIKAPERIIVKFVRGDVFFTIDGPGYIDLKPIRGFDIVHVIYARNDKGGAISRTVKKQVGLVRYSELMTQSEHEAASI